MVHMYIVIWTSGPYVYSYLGLVARMYIVIWTSGPYVYSYLG